MVLHWCVKIQRKLSSICVRFRKMSIKFYSNVPQLVSLHADHKFRATFRFKISIFRKLYPLQEIRVSQFS